MILPRTLGLYKLKIERLLELPSNVKPAELDLALVTHADGATHLYRY